MDRKNRKNLHNLPENLRFSMKKSIKTKEIRENYGFSKIGAEGRSYLRKQVLKTAKAISQFGRGDSVRRFVQFGKKRF